MTPSGLPSRIECYLYSRFIPPLPGIALADCRTEYGDKIECPVQWKGGNLGALAGRPVRLRFQLKECDLYSLRFR